MTTLYDFQLNSATTSTDVLAPLKGNVVLLVTINTGTYHTLQLYNLQQLYSTYRDQGFTVVGVPDNGPWHYGQESFRSGEYYSNYICSSTSDCLLWQQAYAWWYKLDPVNPPNWYPPVPGEGGDITRTELDDVNPRLLPMDANTATLVASELYPITDMTVCASMPGGPAEHPLFAWLDQVSGSPHYWGFDKFLFDTDGNFVKKYWQPDGKLWGHNNNWFSDYTGIAQQIRRLLPHPKITS
jgi:glutathione peroxidase-family protein